MFDSLLDALGNSWWAYPLILASCTFDAILPLLPSETALLTGGILAANGSMLLGWVIVMAAVGKGGEFSEQGFQTRHRRR